MLWFECLAVVGMAFVIGSLLGSFLNVVIHRVPRRESVVFGGSRCPWCRSPVRPRDNVPVVGWLVLRGRCRDCGGPISPRYPLVEAGCGLIAAIAAAAVVCAV
jgi:leader peptidase (prepilin peptidase)/N-methyltransferase